jgi:hypothetical protein
MKLAKYALCAFMLLAATACSILSSAGILDSTPYPTPTGEIPTDEAAFASVPIYFDSEELLLDLLRALKKEGGSEDELVVIQSHRAGKQSYYMKDDAFKLASLTELYRPKSALKGLTLDEIHISKASIVYHYSNEARNDGASFVWLREMPPQVAMNELFGRGAISEREIEYNGIQYVFLEWSDTKTEKTGGFSVHWAHEGRAYQASIPAGYTGEAMLEFCQYQTVIVK